MNNIQGDLVERGVYRGRHISMMALTLLQLGARGKIAPYPGPESAIPGFKGYPDLIALKPYDPAAYWQDLNLPTLIIGAEDEELFDRRVNGMALDDTLEYVAAFTPGQLPETEQVGAALSAAYERIATFEQEQAEPLYEAYADLAALHEAAREQDKRDVNPIELSFPSYGLYID